MSTDAAGRPDATDGADGGARAFGSRDDARGAYSPGDGPRGDPLRTIIDGIPMMVWSARPDGSTEFLNRRCLEYAGLPADAVHEWDWMALVHPDEREAVRDYWRDVVRSGEPAEAAVRMRGVDGAYRWFLVRCSPARDASGAVVRWYGTNTDIEEMQRVAEALQASEQRLRAVIDNLPAFIYTMAPTGEPEFFNRPFLDYLGRTAEEMMDWARIGVIHPDDLARSVAVWGRAVETGEDYALEFRLCRADGVFRWFELRSRTVRDAGGRIVRSYGVVADIHDRKQAERRLRRAMRARQDVLRARERGMREIVDRVPGLVYTMTPEGEVELVNQRILDYFGRTLDELKAWAMTDAVHPDDLPGVVAAWRRAVETGTEYQVLQRLRRSDGAYRWFRGRSLAVRDVGGRVIRWYGLLTDIDDEKRAQRRLRRAMRARFEAVLAERTRIARDMHDGLLQDLSGLALQLGAALPHVQTAPDAAAVRLGRVLDEAQRVNRAARDAVLGMRAQPGAADLVSAVHAEAQRVSAHGGLALSMHVSGPARLVPTAVRDAAVAVVQEALTNVLKHAGARGVRVSIAFRGPRLRVTVRDDGGGMRSASDPAAATAHFGLVGMRERAASIGAELRISTAPGRGTRVGLALALADEKPTETTRRRKGD